MIAGPNKTANENNVTIREVYQLVDSKFNQMASSVDRLETKFDALADGRLSTVEREVANVQGRMMLIPILISAVISVFGIVAGKILK